MDNWRKANSRLLITDYGGTLKSHTKNPAVSVPQHALTRAKTVVSERSFEPKKQGRRLAPYRKHRVSSFLLRTAEPGLGALPCHIPGQALVVGANLPCPALPCPALPCPALPCPALPCPALPCPALSCFRTPDAALPYPQALSCHATPYSAAPSPDLPCSAMPCHAMACPAVLCHAMLCHAMPVPSPAMAVPHHVCGALPSLAHVMQCPVMRLDAMPCPACVRGCGGACCGPMAWRPRGRSRDHVAGRQTPLLIKGIRPMI